MNLILLLSVFGFFVTIYPTVDVFGELIIQDNYSGGDCTKIGTWNSASKTCSLNSDVSENLVIRSNNIILDGTGHLIDGNYDEQTDSPRFCISLDAKFGTTIKNLRITNCAIGISLIDSLQNKIIDNKIFKNFAGGIHMILSNQNEIKNNDISNNPNGGIAFNGNENIVANNIIVDNSHLYLEQDLQGVGISLNLEDSHDNVFSGNNIRGHERGMNFDGVYSSNIVENNIVEKNEEGISLNTSESFLIEKNTIRDNERGIQSYMYGGKGGKNTFKLNNIINNVQGAYIDSGKNIITENTFESNSDYALLLFDVERKRSTHENKIFNNNFINNGRQIVEGKDNFFSIDDQGNYWDDFSSVCSNIDSDSFCDDPYPFTGGSVGVVDEFVWIKKDGWKTAVTKPPIVSEPIVTSEKQSKQKIPDWVRNIFIWYAEERISEDELLNAIQFLLDQGILKK